MTFELITGITQQQAKRITNQKSLKIKGQPVAYIKNNKKGKDSDGIYIKKGSFTFLQGQ